MGPGTNKRECGNGEEARRGVEGERVTEYPVVLFFSLEFLLLFFVGSSVVCWVVCCCCCDRCEFALVLVVVLVVG